MLMSPNMAYRHCFAIGKIANASVALALTVVERPNLALRLRRFPALLPALADTPPIRIQEQRAEQIIEDHDSICSDGARSAQSENRAPARQGMGWWLGRLISLGGMGDLSLSGGEGGGAVVLNS